MELVMDPDIPAPSTSQEGLLFPGFLRRRGESDPFPNPAHLIEEDSPPRGCFSLSIV